jgi:predicted DNA-binding transcriptional regulator AlpA
MTVEPLLTAREVFETFSFSSPGWVLAQSRRVHDPLPCYRLGADCGPVRFRASEVEAWLAKRSTRAVAS